MQQLNFLIGHNQKLFKFAQTGTHAYSVGVFNNETLEFTLELTLMPTGNSDELPRYTITSKGKIPKWVTEFKLVARLDEHIKEHNSERNNSN